MAVEVGLPLATPPPAPPATSVLATAQRRRLGVAARATPQTGAKGCAFNWTCTQPPGAAKSFCQKDNIEYEKRGGQWGTPCKPVGGFDHNPDCDSAHNFWCYGTSPTDAQAFCTQYQCQLDGDCRGGYYCEKINRSPSVLSPHRSQHLTTTACVPRTYARRAYPPWIAAHWKTARLKYVWPMPRVRESFVRRHAAPTPIAPSMPLARRAPKPAARSACRGPRVPR